MVYIKDRHIQQLERTENCDSLSHQLIGKCGRRCVSISEQDKILVAMCKKQRSASSWDLVNGWKACFVQIKLSTVRIRLNLIGVHAWWILKVLRLTETLKMKRLAWARKHRLWPSGD